jgi:hypothetical protein
MEREEKMEDVGIFDLALSLAKKIQTRSSFHRRGETLKGVKKIYCDFQTGMGVWHFERSEKPDMPFYQIDLEFDVNKSKPFEIPSVPQLISQISIKIINRTDVASDIFGESFKLVLSTLPNRYDGFVEYSYSIINSDRKVTENGHNDAFRGDLTQETARHILDTLKKSV